MSKLVITRKGDFFNRRQRYKVFINGKEAGTVKNDETQEYELEPGTHTVQLKVLWTTSPLFTVNITDGKNAYLKVSNGMKLLLPLYILMFAGLLLPFILKSAKIPISDTLNYLRRGLILPAAIYVFLYSTVFRNKYISVSKDDSNPFA